MYAVAERSVCSVSAAKAWQGRFTSKPSRTFVTGLVLSSHFHYIDCRRPLS